MKLKNYYFNEWSLGNGDDNLIYDSFDNKLVAISNTGEVPYEEMYNYARIKGSSNLQKMTFTERGRMLKKLALFLNKRKKRYYEISFQTGATLRDSWFDIDGGIGVLFSYSSLRKDFLNENFILEGENIPLDKNGEFIGHHILVPKQGVAVHINAFNFPIWGMLEKISANLMAGVPAVIKPSTKTSQLTNALFKDIISSNILPEGSLQLICGKANGVLDHLTYQDIVTFTGSAEVGIKLKSHPNVIKNSIRFNLEADSLNCSVLGKDALVGTPEFEIYVNEIIKEMTIKCGQKCTAIRRIIAPSNLVEPLVKSIENKLSKITIGDPRIVDADMGALASKSQVVEVQNKLDTLLNSTDLCLDGKDFMNTVGNNNDGAFFYPKILLQNKLIENKDIHEIEVFGPVSTIIPYDDLDEAIELSKMGQGSLCSSIITNESSIARKYVLNTGSHHGRILILNRDSEVTNTGHGVAMPLLNHGGPGRAGGGQELGGARAIKTYMQLCALQGTPKVITDITGIYQEGSEQKESATHIFLKYFDDLEIGETVRTKSHLVTISDIDDFANVTGDYFYAHMNSPQLGDTLFDDRVAHGYYVLSRATGLYVLKEKSTVLLNYGLEKCRFVKPVYPGMSIVATLTVKEKNDISEEIMDNIPRGIVKFHLEVTDDNGDLVLVATTIAMVKKND